MARPPQTPDPRSLADRRAAGKACRAQAHRSDQGAWNAPGPRTDLVPRLKAAVAGRQADLLPIRWGRMAQSPFRFYRGSAALMAEDISALPTAGLEVGLCGDAHALNLGAYGDSEDRLVFDLNDFDEACHGPFEWDLKRLAASLVLAGRESGHSEADCGRAVRTLVTSWREHLDRHAEMSPQELAQIVVRPEDGHRSLAQVFAKAAQDTPAALMAKATEPDGAGGFRFVEHAPLVRRLSPSELASAHAAWAAYLETLAPAQRQILHRCDILDGAQRVMGCGSIGVLNWVLLCRGAAEAAPRFIEFKGTRPSCWRAERRSATHRGREVAEATRQMQTLADPFLGWTTLGGQSCLVRQWSHHKAATSPALLEGSALSDYAAVCGMVLAKAQARTGDAAMLAGYAGDSDKLDQALAAFARSYADQVEQDWKTFKAAIARGDLEALDT